MAAPEKPLLILGTRLFALEVSDLVSEIPGFELAGFVENLDRARCREKIEGLPVYWVDELERLAESHWAVCSLGTTERSAFTDQAEARGMRFARLVHPGARVSSRSVLGEGVIVSPGVIISAHTQLGQHVRVNRGALIGHHTEIGDYCTIQPGANIAGACRIGPWTYIGMGANVLDRITIGHHSVVGAGSAVTRDVPDHVQVIGAPARIVRENIKGK
jgi:sugar O-acyltransferase (sialic acid O-acetyltransferase NeuD family)